MHVMLHTLCFTTYCVATCM